MVTKQQVLHIKTNLEQQFQQNTTQIVYLRLRAFNSATTQQQSHQNELIVKQLSQQNDQIALLLQKINILINNTSDPSQIEQQLAQLDLKKYCTDPTVYQHIFTNN